MLEKNSKKAVIAGIAAGIAQQTGINVILIRTLFVIGFLLFGLGLAGYLWLWNRLPEDSSSQTILHFSV
ncbi:MAG TPA: PspC domain-containing protein [Patescibacteria group bacterium]|jgi:phage shock protein PspC (stress-responsive transcriptional regulator)|nr:PspC domain-containing protein [Patescibacteria group bacterium]